MIKCCIFEVDCNKRKVIDKILNLGFKIENDKNDIILCQFRYPSRAKIREFLDLVDMKIPEESEDNSEKLDETSSTDSFEVISQGDGMHEYTMPQIWGRREAEEGCDECVDEKGESFTDKLQTRSKALKSQDHYFENVLSRGMDENNVAIAEDEIENKDTITAQHYNQATENYIDDRNTDNSVAGLEKSMQNCNGTFHQNMAKNTNMKPDTSETKGDKKKLCTGEGHVNLVDQECSTNGVRYESHSVSAETDRQETTAQKLSYDGGVETIVEKYDHVDQHDKQDGNGIRKKSLGNCRKDNDVGSAAAKVAANLNEFDDGEIKNDDNRCKSDQYEKQTKTNSKSQRENVLQSPAGVQDDGNDVEDKEKKEDENVNRTEQEKQEKKEDHNDNDDNNSDGNENHLPMGSKFNVEKTTKQPNLSGDEGDESHANTQRHRKGERTKPQLGYNVLQPKRESNCVKVNDANDSNDSDATSDDSDPDNDAENGAKLVNVIFTRRQHELALKHFVESKCFDYLQKYEKKKSQILVSVNDQDRIAELIDFKKMLKQVTFSNNKYDLMEKVKEKWDSKIVVEQLDKSICLTVTSNVLCQIEDDFPELFGKKKVISVSSELEYLNESKSERNDPESKSERNDQYRMLTNQDKIRAKSQVACGTERPINEKNKQFRENDEEEAEENDERKLAIIESTKGQYELALNHFEGSKNKKKHSLSSDPEGLDERIDPKALGYGTQSQLASGTRKEKNKLFVENDEDDERKELGGTTIEFTKAQHELALKWFADSKIAHHLSIPYFQDSSVIICVDDQVILDELCKFKKKLKQVKVSHDNYDVVQDILKSWSREIVVEHLDDDICLIMLYDTLIKIEKDIPELRETDRPFPFRSKYMDEHEWETEDGIASKGLLNFEGHYTNFVVKIHKGNITELPVDVIVNAATNGLNNTGGVAKVIAQAAGAKLKDQCEKHIKQNGRIAVTSHFVSTGGNLRAKKVYHAVGPKYSHYGGRPEECQRDLRLTILKCLVKAEQERFHSIAFPSISAAGSGVPSNIYLESYMKAVLHFEVIRYQHDLKSLHQVHFVDIDDERVNAIREYFEYNWHKPIDKRDQQFCSDQKAMNVYFTRNKSGSMDDSTSKADMGSPAFYGASSSGTGAKPKSSSSWLQKGIQKLWSGFYQQAEEECEICIKNDVETQKMPCCEHVLCKNCFKRLQRCPFCRKIYGIITGDQPKGHMIVKRDEFSHLPGFEKKGLYEITYFFDEVSISRPHRTAYLPATSAGSRAVRLLMLAFCRRLTFTVGRSVTTGRDNQITWNDIHHKTSRSRDHSYGYPDDTYFERLNEELEAKGVTKISMTEEEKSDIDDRFDELLHSSMTKVSSR